MKEVIAYKTADGSYFDTEQEAEYHESWRGLEDWYDTFPNKLFGRWRSDRIEDDPCGTATPVSLDVLANWILNNPDQVALIQKIGCKSGETS